MKIPQKNVKIFEENLSAAKKRSNRGEAGPRRGEKMSSHDPGRPAFPEVLPENGDTWRRG
jgi:hypothetical protein